MSNDPEFGGIIKLYDGLYISEEIGARDFDSIVMYHITHIVNCSAEHLPNFFQKDQVNYLTFKFNELNQDSLVLDQNDKNITEIFSFIETCRDQGESVLIHGFKQYLLPLVLFAAYLMLKFRWTLNKSFQFLERRVGPLPIKAGFAIQLRSLETRFKNKIKRQLSATWDSYEGMPLQEITIHNTYLNALGIGKAKSSSYQSKKITNKKVTWREGPARASSSKPRTKLKSILKIGGLPSTQIKEKNQKTSASQSLIKDKERELKTNSSLDAKGYKLIKDRVQDKMRTTIQLFRPPKPQQKSRSRLKSESAEEQEKKPLVNLTNIQKISKPSISNQQFSMKKSLILKQRLNTDQNVDSACNDLAKQMIKKLIFEKNNNLKSAFASKDFQPQQNNKERSKNTSDVGLNKDCRTQNQNKHRPIVDNFMNQSKQQILRPHSKPQSPAQKPIGSTNGNGLKFQLKLKSQFRGFSPMLKQNKKKEMQLFVSNKMFNDGSRRAWK